MSWGCPVNGRLQPTTKASSIAGVQVEGFAGGGSSQCGPFVPVFSAFGVAAAPADGLAAALAEGLGTLVLTEGEDWQLLISRVMRKLKITIRRTRFIRTRSFAFRGLRVRKLNG